MTDNNVSDYITYRKVTKNLMTIIGLWPYENPSFFYQLVPYIQILLSLGMGLGIFGFVLDHFSNIGLVTRGLSVMTSFITIILKVVCLVMNQKELVELHTNLDPYFDKLLTNSKLTKIVLKKVKVYKFLSWSLAFCVFTCLAAYIIGPLVYITNCYFNKITITKYPLIYPSGYPWKITSNGFVYKIHFIFETLATSALFFVTCSIDSLFTLYVFQMVAQLREMSYCITHIENEDDSQEVVCKCVNQYEKIIRSKYILEKIYGPTILWIMASNAVVLCTLLFQVSQMKSISIIRGMLIVTYVGIKVIQTFMYAWAGSNLTEESEVYRRAVYAANWYGNKNIMAHVIITLSQKPLTLNACSFAHVSVDIFVKVLNTTVSYFFLLQTLDE
ncbi:odorant receptor 4-like isoform X1 [Cotesia glomerata]|uniref:odorant receptor 4-like isoform X1 n=1 Tax=Cotesia glomerata TaxID=32391 RepID=UPI001D00D10D|nr:odorant receptor 4-like isoform X1 [Cotesia glomerata]